MAISAEDKNFLVSLYVGYFNRAPDPAGLQFWIDQVEAGRDTNTIAADFAASPEAKSLYPFLTTPDVSSPTSFITAVYANLFNRAPDAAGQAFWEAQLSSGAVSPADAIDAIIKGATTAPDSTILSNKIVVGLDFATDAGNTPGFTFDLNGASGNAAKDAISGVTEDAATVTAAQAATDAYLSGASNPGQSFTLTANVDNLSGTSGNDTFDGQFTVVAGAGNDTATLGTLDVVDGGAGTDTLQVINQDGAVSLPAATISNVEILDVRSAGAVTVDTQPSNITGVTTVKASANGGAVDIDTKSDVTTVEVSGTATTVDVTDNGAASKDTIKSVSSKGNTGALTIASDALTTLSLEDTNQNATITAAAATRDLTVNVDNVTGGIVADAEATGVTVNAVNNATTAMTLNAAKATAVTLNADEALTVTDVNIAAAKTITATGDSKVTIAAATTVTALESLDASGSTGGLDVDAFALGTGVSFTGGAGADAVQLGATTKAITMGDGDDRALLSAGTTALGSGGSIDGGAGTLDVIAFADADDATTASGATTLEGTISNFERVELAGAAGAAVTVNLANLDDISNVLMSADVTQTIAVNGMASGGTLAYTAGQASATTAVVTNAAADANDSINISIAGAAALTNAGVTVADVQNINVVSNDTDKDTTDADIAHVITALTATSAENVVVTGNAGLTLTGFTATTVKTFDASGMTTKASDGGVSYTTGALTNTATLTGSGGDDTFVFTAATKAVTVNGGAGDDTITTTNAQANVINAGDGGDTVTVGSGKSTVDLGAGDDTLVVGTVTTQTSSITLGAGTDTIDINAVQGSAGAYLSVQDMAKGDIIDVADVDNGAIAGATLGTATTLGASATFANYLDAIAAGDGSANSTDGWFQLNGNTYLVVDNSAAATFQDGSDIVIELVGTQDLSTMTQAGGVYTFA